MNRSGRVLRRGDSGVPDLRGLHRAVSHGHDRPRSDSAEMAAVRLEAQAQAGSVSLRKREVHGQHLEAARRADGARAQVAARVVAGGAARSPRSVVERSRRSARERRGALFAMWRETAGTDDEVGAAGRKARATIEAFIRDRLPDRPKTRTPTTSCAATTRAPARVSSSRTGSRSRRAFAGARYGSRRAFRARAR